VVVSPLTESSAVPKNMQLHPIIELDGRRYVMFTQELAAVPRQTLGRTAERERYAIVAAIDLLFTSV
jgi:hypothetical protein